VISETVVLDSSVFVAIFRGEDDGAELTACALRYKQRLVSAATWLEAAIVCEGSKSRGGTDRFERIVGALGVEVVPLTPEQARIALEAFKQFGKGRGAKASLNYGDCFVYALAKERGAPLLFKGNDFIHTDLQPA
jgi:ribonuclease VapC